MEPGDVLFFNGQLVHGSFPNRSQDRFRRSLIGHYIVGDARKVGMFYQPALRFDSTELTFEVSEGAGPCGVWRDLPDGERTIEMAGDLSIPWRSE